MKNLQTAIVLEKTVKMLVCGNQLIIEILYIAISLCSRLHHRLKKLKE